MRALAPAGVRRCAIFCVVTETHPDRVCALVVAYRPDMDALRCCVEAARAQCAAVLIVANACIEGEADALRAAMPDAVVQAHAANLGLAAAQNTGIAWARAQRFTHVLLLDQDSVPTPGMVAVLLETLAAQRAGNPPIAAVGPAFTDERDAQAAPFVRIGFPFNHKLYCVDGEGCYRADFLIGSGMLIPLSVLDAVGEIDASLFVDNVDLEWCFRARAKGYRLLGVCAACLQHRLGDARRHLRGLPRGIVVHGPLRLYYMMRNRVRLYGMAHVPRVWVAQDLLRLPVKFLLFALLIAPRRRNAYSMLRGLWDGLRRRSGEAPAAVRARA